jgi:hypothetical protein
MKAIVQVFLSYAREDKAEVEDLYQKLSDAGFKPWMAEKDILPGERWKSSIQRAIRSSDLFLVCLSTNSATKRGFLQKEIRDALEIWQEKLESDIYLIPVRLEDCEVPEALRDFQWVDLFKENGWKRLVLAIQEGVKSPGEQIKPHNRAAPTGSLPFNLRFANREDELQTVLKPIHNPGAPRYLEICAPTGYGKTYLLREAVGKFREAGWLCASIDFLKEDDLRANETLLLLKIGDQLGVRRRIATPRGLARYLHGARQQSVIVLDALDLAGSAVRRWIKAELIRDLEERVINPRFKPYFIGASKYPVPEWRVYSRERFKTLKLTPFTENVIDGILRDLAQAAGQDLPGSYFTQMGKTILWVSKGHPRCIGEVLQVIDEEDFTLPAADLMRPETLHRVLGPVIEDEMLAGVRDEFKQTFKTLCVLRGYAPNILDRLEATGVIPHREFFDWDLEDELLSTHLVDPPNGSSLYRFEPLIRQITFLYQETKRPEIFWRLNDLALAVYEEQILGVDARGRPLPQPPRDRLQVACIVEALFHRTRHLGKQDISGKEGKQQLLQALNRYLASCRTGQGKKFWADLLISALDRDDELKDLVYELTGDYDFLLEPVRQLRNVGTRGK